MGKHTASASKVSEETYQSNDEDYERHPDDKRPEWSQVDRFEVGGAVLLGAQLLSGDRIGEGSADHRHDIGHSLIYIILAHGGDDNLIDKIAASHVGEYTLHAIAGHDISLSRPGRDHDQHTIILILLADLPGGEEFFTPLIGVGIADFGGESDGKFDGILLIYQKERILNSLADIGG